MRFYVNYVPSSEREVILNEETLRIKKSCRINDNDFIFKFDLKEERNTFLGTKVHLKDECLNVKYMIDYVTSKSENIPLTPFTEVEETTESVAVLDKNGGYLDSFYNAYSSISNWWSKPKN